MSLNPMMPALASILVIGGAFFIPTVARAEVYELRTYTTNEGKLDNLNARFRDHTVGLFDKHGKSRLATGCPRMSRAPRTR